MREISQTDIAGVGARHTVHHSIKEIRVANNDGFATFTFCGQAHCSLVFSRHLSSKKFQSNNYPSYLFKISIRYCFNYYLIYVFS